MQLEEPLDLLALASSAAHQQVAQLIHRPQLVEDVTPLQTVKQTVREEEHEGYHTDVINGKINHLSGQQNKFLWRDVVLLND